MARPSRTRSNAVRIVGGRWGGRVLRFPDVEGLRPTPDRMRETLFNWLGQRLDGWCCLDLFAGSGALGFEAASRGAARVVLVERDARALAALRANIDLFDAGGVAQALHGEARAVLAADPGGYDLILLDPPFASGLLAEILPLAATRLAPGGRIYAETGDPALVENAPGLAIARRARAGQSHCFLLECV